MDALDAELAESTYVVMIDPESGDETTVFSDGSSVRGWTPRGASA
jgi:hypothetical protein